MELWHLVALYLLGLFLWPVAAVKWFQVTEDDFESMLFSAFLWPLFLPLFLLSWVVARVFAVVLGTKPKKGWRGRG